MRTICEHCHARTLKGSIRCQGDDENCSDVMRYDAGYDAAVERACEWLKANTHSFRSDEFLEPFVEAIKQQQ